jgi:predicted dehydrogenase
MASTRPLRIGLLSAAHVHAGAYAEVLRAMPEIELIGLADDDAAQGDAFARTHGVRYVGDRDALVAERPDAAVVTSPNSQHRADVEALAAAGIGVLCEKPLATTVEDAVAIVRACRAAGVTLMTAFPMRFSPPLLAVAGELGEGRIGRVCAVAAVNQGELPSRHRAWFADPVLAGGGAVMDHTVHLVDLLRWILGREVTEVYATTNRILHADRAQVETGGLLLLHLGDVFVTIDCSWSRPDTYPTWGGLAMEIIGERGVLEVDAFRQRFTLHAAGAPHGSWIYWGSDPNLGMLRAFVASVRDAREPPISGIDGLRAVEVVAAAYASASSGASVKLEPVAP